MSNNEEKSKTNGVGSDQLVRLASFKTPRDLSLGGVKPNKKVFTPNLNVTRNKTKGPASLNSLDSRKKDDKGKKDRKNEKNKNFKNGPNIIKAGGVFSEGIGAGQRSQSRTHYGNNTESGGQPALRKPSIRAGAGIKVDKESEDRKIKIALGDGGLLNDDDCENFSKARQLDAPIKLPMGGGGWIPRVRVKKEIDLIVKQEPTDDINDTLPLKPLAAIKNEVFDDIDLVNLLKTDKPTIIMLQFPMTLPGQGGSSDDDRPRKTQDQDSNQEHNHKKEDSRCRLSQLSEGRIGKLRIHRSGRVTLALGDTVLEVSIGTSSAFYEEIVSVSVDEDSRSASMVSMAPLVHKMVIYPDWETLLKDLA